MNKILYNITKYLLGVLKRKRVDISKIVPDTDVDTKRRTLEQLLYIHHTDMSLLRMDIMRMQNDFIKSTKEPLMEQLKSMTNIEDRDLLIRDIEEQLITINRKYDEHKEAMLNFDASASNLIDFKRTNKLI